MLQQYFLNVGLQWMLFLTIPLVIYLIFFRKENNLFAFFGIKKTEKAENKLLIFTSLLSLFYLIINFFMMKEAGVGSGDIRFIFFEQTGLSIQTLLALFINSIIQTSFLEEIIFRGFLINALHNKLSFNTSNHIQAIAFTGIHVAGTLQMGLSLPFIIVGNLIIYILSILWGKLTKESGHSIYYAAFFHGIINLLTGLFLFSPF